METASARLESAHALQRREGSAPRYTSYPAPDRFVEAFGSEDYAQALRHRQHPVNAQVQPLALQVHIPFCESLCYFCKCNKVITRKHSRATSYLHYLEREVALQCAEIGMGQKVSQLHLVGGTPTYLSDGELASLMSTLAGSFTLASDGDYSIAVDPRTVDAARIQTLADLGFNRISFGIQDFDETVQKAVHRIQSLGQVRAVIDAARHSGFASVSVDLICGLPLQSPESFARTVATVTQLRPDRIAMFTYDHAPMRYRPQRHISSSQVPSSTTCHRMFCDAVKTLVQAGYVYIGMDDFALSTDPLVIAKRQGRLHRSLNGYSHQRDGDLIGLGVSATSRIGTTYSQNAMDIPHYYEQLDNGQFPVVRGLVLTRDDLVRRAVMMALICQGQLSFEAIELSYLLTFSSYFANEMTALRRLAEQDLVKVDKAGIQLTDHGLLSLPSVAMVFDRHLQNDRSHQRFSQII